MAFDHDWEAIARLDYAVSQFVRRNGPASTAEIARGLGHPTAKVHRSLDRIARMGHVYRHKIDRTIVWGMTGR